MPAPTALHPGSAPVLAAERPPVLLLHGLGADHRATFEATGWIRALHKAGRTVIAPDLPGHGGGPGPAPRDPERYRIPLLVADLLATLPPLSDPGGGRVDVIGYSLGARLAWELAVRHPARVRTAVLAGFGPRAQDGAEEVLRELVRLSARSAALGAPPAHDVEALNACVRGTAADPFRAEPAPDCPVLLAAGTEDGLADGVEELAEGLASARLLRIPGRDHRNAVSANTLKKSALAFLDEADRREAGSGPAGASGTAGTIRDR
ncbi:alpha/beta fold hydrolase [Phaeacidiphilus oryzae]|jgi:pimeloyl-ACP methyl ester carboxylesterase|uniref:alpha/beta fold hydrolase n=1 Tax=Phaeacidiphilus oryzae TaxID=348818 RepID=UPI000691AD60|nr:alpha/beta fold hydrolase [Phaeacidiphilus oryzae]